MYTLFFFFFKQLIDIDATCPYVVAPQQTAMYIYSHFISSDIQVSYREIARLCYIAHAALQSALTSQVIAPALISSPLYELLLPKATQTSITVLTEFHNSQNGSFFLHREVELLMVLLWLW